MDVIPAINVDQPFHDVLQVFHDVLQVFNDVLGSLVSCTTIGISTCTISNNSGLEKVLISRLLVTLLHIRGVIPTPQSPISPVTPRDLRRRRAEVSASSANIIASNDLRAIADIAAPNADVPAWKTGIRITLRGTAISADYLYNFRAMECGPGPAEVDGKGVIGPAPPRSSKVTESINICKHN